MKGWEPQVPSGCPMDRLAGEAVRSGEARKLRRLRRNQRVLSGVTPATSALSASASCWVTNGASSYEGMGAAAANRISDGPPGR